MSTADPTSPEVRIRRVLLALVVACALLGGASASAPGTRAGELVDQLVVKGRAPKTGYSREQFGVAWSDVDRNGCDTRNDILNRDLTDKTWRDGTHGCVVIGGVLSEPYTRRTVRFVKADAATVQIDHVVALSDAWQTGASFWDNERRTRFANDPANLLAVDGPANEAKGDADAASWLPPNKAYRCAYVARQVSVKLHWQLWATQAERAAFERVLATCPAQPLPDEAASTGPSSPKPTVNGGPPTTGAVYYANCAAARAAGAAPVHRGEPGYRTALDGDGDGLACE
jgi:hypothetical protein